MKTTIAVTVIAMSLVACASNQTTESGDAAENSAASASEMPKRKKVCRFEKTNGGGSRMERVCKYVTEE